MARRPGSPSPTAPVLPEVHLLRDSSRAAVAPALRSRAVLAVRPGAYVATPEGSQWDRRRTLMLARIAAVHAQLRVEHVISHQSAAALWGLPLIDDGSRVHVVQSTTSHRRGARDVVRHEHHLDPGDVVCLQGLPVTSLSRTVTDCALSLPPSAAMVVADAGLRAGACRERISELVAARVSHRGIVSARAVLDLADAGAESPGESLTRHLLLRAGFPVPSTQVMVRTADGPAWGDLGWEPWHLIAEYDGVAKYTARGSTAEFVLAERRREVVIEREGWRVLRVTKADLRQPQALSRLVLQHAPARTVDHLRPRRELVDPVRRPRDRQSGARPSGGDDGLEQG